MTIWTKQLKFSQLLYIIGAVLLLINVTTLYHYIISGFDHDINYIVANPYLKNVIMTELSGSVESTSTISRLNMLYHGWHMFIEAPIMGAGLGSFVSSFHEHYDEVLTMHNTIAWIVAEMGLLGLLLAMILPYKIIQYLWYKGINTKDNCALLHIMIVALIFSQMHDIAYQRILWFALGLVLAHKISLHRSLPNT